ncbi:MAG: hypothetical protein CO108_30955 [Deltaproteobacteria bacterium CG_4_9_14_3_um_filter_63_12]|nr:MAG: hypothetical protein CO108_30955 [Deltaproteobacteria bacterium CG_4_9_14_3_um_filter_63_12]
MTSSKSKNPAKYTDWLPVGAVHDEVLLERVRSLVAALPGSLSELGACLAEVESFAEFDSAAVLAAQAFDARLDDLLRRPPKGLFEFMRSNLPVDQQLQVCRRLVKHPNLPTRRRAVTLLKRLRPDDVALPLSAKGEWNWRGWTRGTEPGRLFKHRRGVKRQAEVGVPQLKDLEALRRRLAIDSLKQLGWFMTATAGEGAPYCSFEIPKRSGGLRRIDAPRGQLRALQRTVLHEILSKVAVHEAAHGFVPGRSTLTNAAPHLGRKLVLKFDLRNFFPTISYWRVVGLLASLGYDVGTGLNVVEDSSRAVAPVLARLLTFRDDAKLFGAGYAPQGAPTSPAISNLVCRGLDGRLSGLAARIGGTYTRYADDLTFSMDAEPAGGLGRFRWWVDGICQQEGFLLNREKFRVLRASRRQQITGIVVNDSLRVPREVRRKVRAMVHNCQKNGVEAESKGDPGFVDRLRGLAAYIHMVHPEEGRPLLDAIKLFGEGGEDD